MACQPEASMCAALLLLSHIPIRYKDQVRCSLLDVRRIRRQESSVSSITTIVKLKHVTAGLIHM